MAQLRVDPETILDLGRSLLLLSQETATEPDVAADRWAFGPGQAAAALDELLCGWRLERLRLAHSLYDLGDAAGCAGAAYVSVDEGVARMWGGTMS